MKLVWKTTCAGIVGALAALTLTTGAALATPGWPEPAVTSSECPCDDVTPSASRTRHVRPSIPCSRMPRTAVSTLPSAEPSVPVGSSSTASASVSIPGMVAVTSPVLPTTSAPVPSQKAVAALPVTGVSIVVIALAGLVMVMVGVGAIVVARRRRL
jgi:LPXTG-motif cell wall-anchored protein